MKLARVKTFLGRAFPCLCVGLALVLQLSLVHKYSTGGERIVALSEEAISLVKDNGELTNQIAAVSSLAVIKEKSLELGFVAAELEYLLPPSLASR